MGAVKTLVSALNTSNMIRLKYEKFHGDATFHDDVTGLFVLKVDAINNDVAFRILEGLNTAQNIQRSITNA